MQFHLDHGGLDPAQRQDRFQFRNCHAAHADVLRQAHVHQAFHLAPGVHELFHGEGLAVRIPAVTVAARCMIVRERPVDKVEVQIVQAQILQGLRAGKQDISLAVHIIPDLGGDEKFFAFHNAFLHRILKDLADQVLVTVHGSAVKQPVAAADRSCHRIGYLFGGEAVAAKGTHAHARDFLTVGQFPFRNQFRINECHVLLLLEYFGFYFSSLISMILPWTSRGFLYRANASAAWLSGNFRKIMDGSNFSRPSAKQSAVSFHSFPGNGAE